MIEVYDDIVPEHYQKYLKDTLMDASFPWYYWPHAIPVSMRDTHAIKSTKYSNPSQLKHVLLFNNKYSNFYGLVDPIIAEFINYTGYELVKVHTSAAIMQHPAKAITTIQPHVDYSEKEYKDTELKTLIYYVNGGEGSTTLYKEYTSNIVVLEPTILDIKEPKMGRIALINANQFHSGSEPSTGIRVLLNVIMEIKRNAKA